MNNISNKLLMTAASVIPTFGMAQQAQRPNIMLIVVDDMGYSDLECFGGEVQSPNLNGLAEDGSRFTQFFNCGRSCPSRASLLTGCYPHEVGITGMGLDLSTNCVTVAEALKNAGYHTAMSGKWHLSRTAGIGNNNDQMLWLSHQGFKDRDFANKATYPCNRGFDEHYGTIWGVSDHFDPFSLVHNEQPLFTDGIPEDFYYADYVADKAIDMMGNLAQQQEPFFMYVAFQEPHWPVQAKPEDIAKYKGVYNDGWDALRTRRYNKMVEMGLVDPNVTPNAPNASNRNWNNEARKEWQAANMEVHAAMVDCVDQNIGRIIAELKAKGLYDNTLIVFSSDNGASSENYSIGDFDRHNMTRDGQQVVHNADVPGSQLTYNYLDTGWAGAINAPFRYWKRQSFHGGVAAPTIIKWPASMNAEKNTIVHEPCNFIDFMPTCLELADATYPTTYNGRTIQPIAEEARSLVPMAKAGAKWDTERIMFWEHENGMAVRTADWRLTKHTNGEWQLFDMRNDYSETNNVASAHPDIVLDLKKKWQAWAVEVGLRKATVAIETGKVYSISNRNDNNLYIQDNGGNPLPMGAFNDNSYWTFEPTGNPDCYYIKNVTSGRYAQACPTSAEQDITMGDTKVEYKIQDCSVSEGTDCFGIASTNLGYSTYFTTGCLGWNWKGGNTVQTYAAAEGTNHRSFWKISEVNYVDPSEKWPLDGKAFTITNEKFQSNSFMQDNSAANNMIDCAQTENDNSYWVFEKTATENCYYVKNSATGRYIQGYENAPEKDVYMGDAPTEYYVKSFANEGGCYGFSFTGNEPHDFASTATMGLNLRKDPTEDGCCVQSFKAHEGENHRSFWKLTEVQLPDPEPTGVWPLAGKTFSISNRNDNNLYVQDNGGNPLPMGAFNDNSYWQFEPASKSDCYYVKNVTTGRYAQECSATAEVPINMGETKVEYMILDCSAAEGAGCYGFSSTNLSVTDFTDGCIGWNWKNDNTVQTFAAKAGTNHRSFWKLTEVQLPEPEPTGEWPLDGKVYTIKNKIENHGPSYMQDNAWNDNRIECANDANAYAYWTFEKTANSNCYNIKNTATGRYFQGYSENQVIVTLGTTPAEYFVDSFENEGGAYGFSFTGNTPHDCSEGTLGLNLRAEPNEPNCLVQTFAAKAGTNHRSFWVMTEHDKAPITVTDAGFATFVAPFNVTVPDDIEAYSITAIGNTSVSLSQVTEVPVGEAVLVKAPKGTYAATMQATASSLGTNELKATRNHVAVNEAFKYYILSKVGDIVGFYPVQVNTTIKAGKGYLENTTSEAKAFIALDDESTGLQEVILNKLDGTKEIYNIQGQRLQTPQRGVNIINGKAYLVK